MMMKLAVLVLVFAAVVQTRADAPAPPEPTKEYKMTAEMKEKVMLDKKPQVLRPNRLKIKRRPRFRFPVGRRYFWYFSTPKTWVQAEKFCRSIGGNLASVRNRWENKMLLRLIRKTRGRYSQTWIGGSDVQMSGVWFWSDRSNYQYTNWCRAKPNKYSRRRQHCLQMSSTKRRCWSQLECWKRRPFICLKRRW
ncbi:hypothetical protein OJAV_G00184870 [Oryzias javanicus]|uniref:C-type lectin domain-containing protein n=1 Tax=Oryzias javanicus TaxID=123683 RepID=A0A437CDB5_ORYJA|nr:hypothetical protein OJAV_G00184870 [Oryzias javanicus]